MTIKRILSVALPLLGMLSACDRSDPPSERLERAAEELVSDVENEALPTQRPDGPWAPRNDCGELPGASAFLASLKSAIDARDADALVALTAEDVKLDFGGGAGAGQLRERLAANDGAHWETLARLMDLGCATSNETSLTLPWYFAQTIPVDPYMGAIVTGEDVSLHDAPDTDAPVLATISWDAVERLPDDTAREGFERVAWIKPKSEERVEGYIAEAELRGLIDYRLIANRRNNRWRITALIAGD